MYSVYRKHIVSLSYGISRYQEIGVYTMILLDSFQTYEDAEDYVLNLDNQNNIMII
jgi:hypothetical protein